jgi:hypothetical protein
VTTGPATRIGTPQLSNDFAMRTDAAMRRTQPKMRAAMVPSLWSWSTEHYTSMAWRPSHHLFLCKAKAAFQDVLAKDTNDETPSCAARSS